MNSHRRYQNPNFCTHVVKPLQVLVTGFEPFGQSTTNSSQMVVEQLQLLESPSSIEMQFKILPVTESGAKDTRLRMEKGENFDIVFHLGLCESCEEIRIETRATDSLQMRIPDNEGRQILSSIIDGKGSIYSDLPLHKVFERDEHLIESIDAGSFVCNETFRQTLLGFDDQQKRKHCVFIHLPSEHMLPIEELTSRTFEVIKTLTEAINVKTIPVAALAVVSSSGECFAAYRVESTISGWEFPGGKIEKGESIHQAIERECQEELNLEIQPQKTLGRWDYQIKGKWYSLFLVKSDLPDGSIEHMELREHEKVTWVALDEIVEFDWLPHDRDMARYLSRIIPDP